MSEQVYSSKSLTRHNPISDSIKSLKIQAETQTNSIFPKDESIITRLPIALKLNQLKIIKVKKQHVHPQQSVHEVVHRVNKQHLNSKFIEQINNSAASQYQQTFQNASRLMRSATINQIQQQIMSKNMRNIITIKYEHDDPSSNQLGAIYSRNNQLHQLNSNSTDRQQREEQPKLNIQQQLNNIRSHLRSNSNRIKDSENNQQSGSLLSGLLMTNHIIDIKDHSKFQEFLQKYKIKAKQKFNEYQQIDTGIYNDSNMISLPPFQNLVNEHSMISRSHRNIPTIRQIKMSSIEVNPDDSVNVHTSSLVSQKRFAYLKNSQKLIGTNNSYSVKELRKGIINGNEIKLINTKLSPLYKESISQNTMNNGSTIINDQSLYQDSITSTQRQVIKNNLKQNQLSDKLSKLQVAPWEINDEDYQQYF